MDEKILIVEDDQDTRYLLTQILRRNGYVPVPVSSGEEAVSRGESERPDLVILDLGLPGIDGWETLRRLRDSRPTARVPVVVLTAREGPDHVIRAYASGAAYYMSKPCRQEELLRGVRVALGQLPPGRRRGRIGPQRAAPPAGGRSRSSLGA